LFSSLGFEGDIGKFIRKLMTHLRIKEMQKYSEFATSITVSLGFYHCGVSLLMSPGMVPSPDSHELVITVPTDLLITKQNLCCGLMIQGPMHPGAWLT
jgi:hypothetical protein